MQKSKKLSLKNLEVRSFVTDLQQDLRGGALGTGGGCQTDTIETECPASSTHKELAAFAFC